MKSEWCPAGRENTTIPAVAWRTVTGYMFCRMTQAASRDFVVRAHGRTCEFRGFSAGPQLQVTFPRREQGAIKVALTTRPQRRRQTTYQTEPCQGISAATCQQHRAADTVHISEMQLSLFRMLSDHCNSEQSHFLHVRFPRQGDEHQSRGSCPSSVRQRKGQAWGYQPNNPGQESGHVAHVAYLTYR